MSLCSIRHNKVTGIVVYWRVLLLTSVESTMLRGQLMIHTENLRLLESLTYNIQGVQY